MFLGEDGTHRFRSRSRYVRIHDYISIRIRTYGVSVHSDKFSTTRVTQSELYFFSVKHKVNEPNSDLNRIEFEANVEVDKRKTK